MQDRGKRPPISLEDKEKEKGLEPGALSYTGNDSKPLGKKKTALLAVQALFVMVAALALSIYATTQLAPSLSKYAAFVGVTEERLSKVEATQSKELVRVDRVVDTMGEYAKTGHVRENIEIAKDARNLLEGRISKIEQALLVKTSGVEVSYYSPYTIRDAGSYPISLTIRNHSVEGVSGRVELSLTPSVEAGIDIAGTSLFVTKTPNFKWTSVLVGDRLVFSSDDVSLKPGETFIELTLELAYIDGEPQAKWFPGVMVYN